MTVGAIGVTSAASRHFTAIVYAALTRIALRVCATISSEDALPIEARLILRTWRVWSTHGCTRDAHAGVADAVGWAIKVGEARGRWDALSGLTCCARRTHDHDAGVDDFASEVCANLAGRTLIIAATIAHEETCVVEAHFSGATVDVVDAAGLRATHAIAAGFIVWAILVNATLRVEDTHPVDTLLVIGTFSVSKALGRTRKALRIYAYFVGSAFIVVATPWNGHTHVLITDLTLWALVVATTPDEVTSTIHTGATQTAIAVGHTLRHKFARA